MNVQSRNLLKKSIPFLGLFLFQNISFAERPFSNLEQKCAQALNPFEQHVVGTQDGDLIYDRVNFLAVPTSNPDKSEYFISKPIPNFSTFVIFDSEHIYSCDYPFEQGVHPPKLQKSKTPPRERTYEVNVHFPDSQSLSFSFNQDNQGHLISTKSQDPSDSDKSLFCEPANDEQINLTRRRLGTAMDNLSHRKFTTDKNAPSKPGELKFLSLPDAKKLISDISSSCLKIPELKNTATSCIQAMSLFTKTGQSSLGRAGKSK